MPAIPPEGRRFKKGQAGGPGRPRILPELKLIQSLTAQTIKEFLEFILTGTENDLIDTLNNPLAPAFKKIYAKAVLKGMKRGDIKPLEMILNRVVGNVKDSTELSSDNRCTVIVRDYCGKKD